MDGCEYEGSKLFENESKFYKDAQNYWSGIEPTIDGMLGGFACVSKDDINGSDLFLRKLFEVSKSMRTFIVLNYY